MGQQQLLVLLVAVVIVGVMASVGFVMFADQAAGSNRDALANDLTRYATLAQQYLMKPRVLGGGGGSMVGFMIPGNTKNPSGSYTITATNPQTMLMEGVGVESGYDEINPVKVGIKITRDSVQVTEIN